MTVASTDPAAATGAPRRDDPLADVTVVIPSVGRDSLHRLLDSLATQEHLPAAVVVVDDAPRPGALTLAPAPRLAGRVAVVGTGDGGGRGPAAARNAGWQAADTTWVVVLDDDVLAPADWSTRLAADLAACPADVAGVQGRVRVPLPTDRRPTDWERQVAGLESAAWATADMALRAAALSDVGGFDERFPRAFREDADLALRLMAVGWRLVRGEREIVHPIPAAPKLVSVGRQAGNADDPLMRVRHGRDWRRRAQAPSGRRPRHLAVTGAAVGALTALLAGRRRLAAAAALAWAAGTAEFAAARIAPGPGGGAEIIAMTASSVLIPPVAAAHWVRGWAAVARRGVAPHPATADPGRRPRTVATRHRAAAVLFDRDGTLVHDVPYNGDPRQVRPVPGAREALDDLRAAGVAVGMVTNQSGIARGLLTAQQVAAVNARVERLLGPLDAVEVCPHGPDDGCRCRKPAPGMIRAAADRLGVAPADCVVVGDIGSDVAAAGAAGARAVLVPTAVTRPQEVATAPVTAVDLAQAVRLVLGGAV